MAGATDVYRRTLGKWAAQTEANLAALARVACQDLAEETIDHTPVDTAFLVGNWQPSLGAPVLSQDQSKGGSGYATSKVGLVISGLKAGDTFYLVNNAAYARRIEFGFVGEDSLGRLYNQQGRHMVTKAIQKWPQIVNGAAMKLGLSK